MGWRRGIWREGRGGRERVSSSGLNIQLFEHYGRFSGPTALVLGWLMVDLVLWCMIVILGVDSWSKSKYDWGARVDQAVRRTNRFFASSLALSFAVVSLCKLLNKRVRPCPRLVDAKRDCLFGSLTVLAGYGSVVQKFVRHL